MIFQSYEGRQEKDGVPMSAVLLFNVCAQAGLRSESRGEETSREERSSEERRANTLVYVITHAGLA